MTNRHVSAHTNLDALLGKLQVSLQRQTDLVSFGLLAADSASKESLFLPGAIPTIRIAADKALDFDNAKSEFQKWVITAGLRDCVEAVGTFLEEVRTVCALWSFVGRSPISGEEWNQRMKQEPKKFHRIGLPDKMSFLRKEYANTLSPELSDEVQSINHVRNCLVHRAGIVSERDINSSDGLLAKWLQPSMRVGSTVAKGETITALPSPVEAGGWISFHQQKTNKIFKLGESVTFDTQEFSGLCWTIFRYGQQMTTHLRNHGEHIGVPFREPD